MLRGIGIVLGVTLLTLTGYIVHEARGEKNVAQKADNRVFEMRIYYANPGKMTALEARFRDHTNKLFEKHGMTIIGFWRPLEKQPNPKNDVKENADKLIYILAYPSVDAAQKSWDSFQKDEVWKKAKAASEVDGKLVGKVESVYMNPTDYSPIK